MTLFRYISALKLEFSGTSLTTALIVPSKKLSILRLSPKGLLSSNSFRAKDSEIIKDVFSAKGSFEMLSITSIEKISKKSLTVLTKCCVLAEVFDTLMKDS